MTIVKQILENKGYDVWSVAPDDSIYAALELMAEKNIGAVLVMEGEDLVGIFSERDYARKIILRGKASRDTPVAEAMTRRVFAVRPDQHVEGCMALMTEKRIRHLPVMRDARVVGLISIGDVVKAVISEQANTIQYLEDYITTGHPEVSKLPEKVNERHVQ
ncbi:MAG TPA: CBS domain-containing protein [Candidatus Binatia bacterium]|jgi:CBS domain-containing protein|nr:CBS domain-containing protein [Candidatus Binatia bacterium]